MKSLRFEENKFFFRIFQFLTVLTVFRTSLTGIRPAILNIRSKYCKMLNSRVVRLKNIDLPTNWKRYFFLEFLKNLKLLLVLSTNHNRMTHDRVWRGYGKYLGPGIVGETAQDDHNHGTQRQNVLGLKIDCDYQSVRD